MYAAYAIILLLAILIPYAADATTNSTTNSTQLHDLKLHMLYLINQARNDTGISPVTLGNNTASQAHADDMLEHCYSSHWGLDGLKPYMRYAISGGYNYESENVAGWSPCITPSDGYQTRSPYSHINGTMTSLMSSVSHRDNILDTHHGIVHLGLAWDDYNMFVVQQFQYNYIEFDTLPHISGTTLSFSARTTNGATFTDQYLMYLNYDDTPHNLTIGQVSRTYCYEGGIYVAAYVAPLASGWRYLDSHVTVESRSCPNPYDIPPDSPPPASRTEDLQYHTQAIQQYYDNRRLAADYTILMYTANRWAMTPSTFEFSTGVGPILREYGDGVYTINVWGMVNGDPIQLVSYPIFWERPG